MATQSSSSVASSGLSLPTAGQTSTVTISPEHAQRLIDAADFGAQRRLRRRRVQEMAAIMNERRWSSGASTGIRFVRDVSTDTLYNVDGQHTLHAIAEANTPVEVDMRYDVASNREEIATEYSKHDRQLSRSAKDNIGAFNLEDEFPLTLTDLGKVSAAVKFIRGNLVYNKAMSLRMHEHIKDIREWAPYMVPFKDCYEGCPGEFREKLLRMPVLAPALVTMRYQSTKAKEFWRGVAWPEDAFNDPRRTLRRYLEKYRLGGSGEVTGPQIKRSKMARAVERAWVYFYEGRGELQVIHPGNKTRPVRFSGTPFHPDAEPVAA